MQPDSNLVTAGWALVHIGVVNDGACINGVDPWKVNWRDLHESPIMVAHPDYPAERHTMWVYELVDPDGPFRFAAGEFSNGVWGFFVPIRSGA